jgi:hypothetical protein
VFSHSFVAYIITEQELTKKRELFHFGFVLVLLDLSLDALGLKLLSSTFQENI